MSKTTSSTQSSGIWVCTQTRAQCSTQSTDIHVDLFEIWTLHEKYILPRSQLLVVHRYSLILQPDTTWLKHDPRPPPPPPSTAECINVGPYILHSIDPRHVHHVQYVPHLFCGGRAQRFDEHGLVRPLERRNSSGESHGAPVLHR